MCEECDGKAYDSIPEIAGALGNIISTMEPSRTITLLGSLIAAIAMNQGKGDIHEQHVDELVASVKRFVMHAPQDALICISTIIHENVDSKKERRGIGHDRPEKDPLFTLDELPDGEDKEKLLDRLVDKEPRGEC